MSRRMGKTGRRAAPSSRKNVWLGLGGGALAIALLALAFTWIGADRAAAGPIWAATSTDGEGIGSDAYKGDVYAVDFFFLTCGICEKQLPSNAGLVNALSGRDDFHFVSVTADPADTVPLIEAHREEKNATWPHVRDPAAELYRKFEVRGNPNIVFIGRDGAVAATVTRLAPTEDLLAIAQRLLDGEDVQAEDMGMSEGEHAGM